MTFSKVQTKEHNHIAYRPNIDGLRAVAVLSVAGYHYFPTLAKGGFALLTDDYQNLGKHTAGGAGFITTASAAVEMIRKRISGP
ncbi:MAG: hypothetical protein LBL48_11375 [Azoarcus sp.]|jgi:peptidoglycan/LPS O-acetylase OafA/YrhL|nr:hypothetical protein [Azoarcus sp.]